MTKIKDSTSRQLHLFRIRLLRLPRGLKQALMIGSDVVVCAACAVIAAWIVVPQFAASIGQVAVMSGLAATLVIPINFANGMYRSIVRFLGIDLFMAGLRSATVVSILLAGIATFANLLQSPVRFAAAFWALAVIAICSIRFLARLFLNRRRNHRDRVLVYGAGAGGVRLAAALSNGDQYLPVAFVDDNSALWGKTVDGLEVHSPDEISSIVDQQSVSHVLLALPSISRKRKRKILQRLTQESIHVQTMPEIADIVAGRARVDDIREVEVEDLLGRDSVPPNHDLLTACIEDKAVMVTGAGGSIGSELCRQILQLAPNKLVLFEISEASLYQIDRQLSSIAQEKKLNVEIIALLGSVHHSKRVREAMQAYGIQTVYHAAAYKHVPMVERNIIEGVHNNVFGTLNTAKAALDSGVETFVLISTDKAVSPTNVMGATKRFAELVLQALHHKNSGIRFCMVRFGNVLASSGSVVPLFREQIRSGGPVTVTHPEIIRYFMTIPEAAQLVIQAGSMATGGDVFVLDMGKPVKILDLARRMVHLMGLSVQDEDNPEGDIAIQFTGLRPAEKLYEELLIGSDVSGTEHTRILRANEAYLTPDRLNPLIDELWDAATKLDTTAARDVLIRAVGEYAPANSIEDLVWNELRKNRSAEAKKVTDLSSYRDQS